jgi:hypothetical protein
MDPGTVRDEYNGDLTVVYTFGPQFGRRVVTHADLEQMDLSPRVLRRSAFDHLEVLSSRAEFHGQPPALMLSFDGLESSLLLATDFWTRLQGALPGELVVGVPARDVVIVTGSQSQAGLEKARRCVERMYFAGDENLLSRNLLVRRGNTWEPFDRAPRPAGRPTFGPAHQPGVGQPPRQYQDHPSWPGERVAPMRPPAAAPAAHRTPPGRPMPAPVAHLTGPLSPSATGSIPAVPPVGPPAGGMAPSSAPTNPVPHQRPTRRRMPQPRTADIAQYSAVPYSALPYSAVPYSAIPYSAMPYSAVPNSGSPYSLAPRVAPQSAMPYVDSARRAPDKPQYRDDLRSTASPLPRALHADYAPVGATRDAGLERVAYDRASGYDSSAGHSSAGHGSAGHSSAGHGGAGHGGGAPDRRDSLDRDAYDTSARDMYGREAEPQMPAYPASWGSAPSASPARSEFRTGPRARFSR